METIIENKKKVELHELGVMLKVIALEFPEITNYEDLASTLSEYFKVECTAKDIHGYNKLYEKHQVIKEDYELENKRHEHGYLY